MMKRMLTLIATGALAVLAGCGGHAVTHVTHHKAHHVRHHARHHVRHHARHKA